jgi:hypothetical protein
MDCELGPNNADLLPLGIQVRQLVRIAKPLALDAGSFQAG